MKLQHSHGRYKNKFRINYYCLIHFSQVNCEEPTQIPTQNSWTSPSDWRTKSKQNKYRYRSNLWVGITSIYSTQYHGLISNLFIIAFKLYKFVNCYILNSINMINVMVTCLTRLRLVDIPSGSRLHTGARVNFVLLTYLLTYCFNMINVMVTCLNTAHTLHSPNLIWGPTIYENFQESKRIYLFSSLNPWFLHCRKFGYQSSRTSRLWPGNAHGWWLQPPAVCSHTSSGVIWHCVTEKTQFNCMTLSWWFH